MDLERLWLESYIIPIVVESDETGHQYFSKYNINNVSEYKAKLRKLVKSRVYSKSMSCQAGSQQEPSLAHYTECLSQTESQTLSQTLSKTLSKTVKDCVTVTKSITNSVEDCIKDSVTKSVSDSFTRSVMCFVTISFKAATDLCLLYNELVIMILWQPLDQSMGYISCNMNFQSTWYITERIISVLSQ